VRRFPASVLAALALAAGCSVSDPPKGEQLGDLGEELVPAGAELVETDEGSCPQIAGNPSCARVFFVAEGSEEERADALEEAARAAGWDVVSRKPRRDGILVELGREGYRAFAAIWEEARAAPCLAEPDTDCADELQLIEDV
jgi:hypothetical protein